MFLLEGISSLLLASLKVPGPTSVDLSSCGDDSLIDHYAQDLKRETVEGIEFEKKAIISTDVRTKWKTYQQIIIEQPKDDMKAYNSKK